MALQAGRYGVTKAQLLKIKKLPMNTIKLIEEVIETLATKADNTVIGTVENGTNPTKAYAVGEHMIRNGKFCTVTSAVTTSSTWTLGSNYVEGDVASELDTVYTASGNNGLLIKKGNHITVNCSGIHLDAFQTLISNLLPSQSIPQRAVMFNYSTRKIIICSINNNGASFINAEDWSAVTDVTTNIQGQITYYI